MLFAVIHMFLLKSNYNKDLANELHTINTEKKVEKPNPLPVLPKNSCSKGASLKSITIII